MFRFGCIFPTISSQLEGALPGTLWNVGVGAAPGGGEQTWLHALGRPWVSVRPVIGSATVSWLDGDRRAARNRRAQGPLRGSAKSPEERTRVLRRREGASEGVPRPLFS